MCCSRLYLYNRAEGFGSVIAGFGKSADLTGASPPPEAGYHRLPPRPPFWSECGFSEPIGSGDDPSAPASSFYAVLCGVEEPEESGRPGALSATQAESVWMFFKPRSFTSKG